MLETINNVLIDKDVLARVPDHMRPYVDSCIGILEDVQRLHETRRTLGFYPKGFTIKDLEELTMVDPDAISPHTLIRRNGGGRLRVVTYKGVPELNHYLRSISSKGTAIFEEVRSLPGADLIRNSLRPMIQSFSEGDFSGAMTARLNVLQTPNHELFIGRFDRHDDGLAGVKYSDGGWLTLRDVEKTERYSQLLQQGAEKTAIQIGEKVSPAHFRRVIVCETIASAGLPADMIWNGNTIPSEDDKRRFEGSVSYAFLNQLNHNLENKGLRDSLTTNAPELISVGSGGLIEGIIFNLIAHEGVGHPLISENPYQPMRELEAEVLGLMGVANMGLPEKTKRAVALVSLAWSKESVDSYRKEEEMKIKSAKRTYAIMGSMLLNFCEMEGVCEVNGEGHISLGETDNFYRAIASKLPVIRNAVTQERWVKGSASNFERIHTAYPRDYKVDLKNGNHNLQPVAV